MRLSSLLVYISVLLALFFYPIYSRSRRMPHWLKKLQSSQGPNVCIIEEAPHIKRTFWTECKVWTNRMVCGKKTRLRFDCCEGYEHITGEPGCAAVKPLKNLYDTVHALGGSEFLKYAKNSDVISRLNNGGPYTLFLPVNSAFVNSAVDTKRDLQSKDGLLAYHFVQGMHPVKYLKGDMFLESLYKQEKVRINKYPNGVITVNCVPIIRPDIQATNGVIHLIDRVITPPIKNTLVDVIQKDPRFNVLASAMKKAGGDWESRLRGHGPFTIFAPSDAAFQKVPSGALEKIMNNPSALEALIKFHIVDHAVCSPVILSKESVKTWQGDGVNVMCNGSGIFVNDNTRLLSPDLLASNGVIHMITNVMLPNQVKTMDLILRERGLNKFVNYFGVAGLSHLLTDSNVTIFAPDDKAFVEFLKKKDIDLSTNSKELQIILQHHVVRGKFESTNIMNSQSLKTFGNTTIHLQGHREKPMTIDSSTVKSPDVIGRNGALYIIDKVMIPPHEDLYQWIASNPKYSILLRVIDRAGPEIIKLLQSARTSSRTFFAPDNEAFLKLPPGMLERMMTDSDLLIRILKYHIIDDYVVTAGLQDKVFYNFNTLEGRAIRIRKDGDDISINLATVEVPDCVALNGVVQTINSLLIPTT